MRKAEAKKLDAKDPLAPLRADFLLPFDKENHPLAYFCGHSLGAQPREAKKEVHLLLGQWEKAGVEQWFSAKEGWLSLYPALKKKVAPLVGAKESEVTLMNSLTVNLHLLLASFFKPKGKRCKMVVDLPLFPSDRFAIESYLRHLGLDPKTHLIEVKAKKGCYTIEKEDFEEVFAKEKDAIALVWINGVNYLTGQFLDIQNLTTLAHKYGALLGVDLAHAIGNVPLKLHAWGVDFAVWCHYKYLNAGPGAVGGAFVHEEHFFKAVVSELKGWWGVKESARFEMDQYIPAKGADQWQLSTPSLLSVAPLKASLAVFEKTAIEALREKSIKLTGFLEEGLKTLPMDKVQIITPKAPQKRGAQLTLKVQNAEACLTFLKKHKIIADLRPPGWIRVAPVPLYNTFSEVEHFVHVLHTFFS